MKRLGCLVIAVTLLSSCQSELEEKFSGRVPCVVESNDSGLILKTPAGIADFQVPQLAEMEVGKCYIVDYNSDYDLNAMSSEKEYSVTITSCQKMDYQGTLNSILSDTSKAFAGETTVADVALYGTVGSYLFFTHTLKNETDSVLKWDISYNSDSPVTVVDDGTRYYDVFLRAVKTDVSCDSVKKFTNAYNMGTYLNVVSRMQSESNPADSVFSIRLNYLTDFTDTTMTWNSKTITGKIAIY